MMFWDRVQQSFVSTRALMSVWHFQQHMDMSDSARFRAATELNRPIVGLLCLLGNVPFTQGGTTSRLQCRGHRSSHFGLQAASDYAVKLSIVFGIHRGSGNGPEVKLY